MARVSYVDRDEMPAGKRELLDTLSNEDGDETNRAHSLSGGTLNVYRTIGRNVDLLEGFRRYGSLVWQESGLSPHERELVILATAYHAETAYEWQQHVRVALDEGMDPQRILAISREELERLEPAHAALVEYVEQFVRGAVDDATHERLSQHYSDGVIVGVGMLAGCYLGLARVLQALEVDLESEFVGWDLENL
ncbi:carboxymuconolactone decarboxylase family protein [Natronorubrum halophilum]|uniref:carboxymuconolactone decarboxylase family protein n=1 Tax=Natronorubrum halophilum TaxID=1702106 RepID=UPI0010C1E4E0|nr:carboxymuconolactone decarboxylase family protein [Natronorubrum halophilum]